MLKKVLLLVLLFLLASGCSIAKTTKEASFTAYGMYTITPMGMVGIGYIDYNRVGKTDVFRPPTTTQTEESTGE